MFDNIKTKLLLGLAGLLVLVAIFVTGYIKGGADARASADKAAIQGVKNAQQKQREVIQLSDPDLDARLSKWMRD